MRIKTESPVNEKKKEKRSQEWKKEGWKGWERGQEERKWDIEKKMEVSIWLLLHNVAFWLSLPPLPTSEALETTMFPQLVKPLIKGLR